MGEMADDLIDRGMCWGYEEDYDYTYGYLSRKIELPSVILYGHQKEGPKGPVETERAMLWVTVNNEEIWFPHNHYVLRGNILVITGWIAKKKGINQKNHQ